MSFLFGLAVGFVAGWVLFKRPAWATEAINWLKVKVGLPVPPVER